MLLHKDFDDAVMLTEQEVKQLSKMFLSGKYYAREIMEEFGLNQYQFKIYLGIAYYLGYIDNPKYKIEGMRQNSFQLNIN